MSTLCSGFETGSNWGPGSTLGHRSMSRCLLSGIGKMVRYPVQVREPRMCVPNLALAADVCQPMIVYHKCQKESPNWGCGEDGNCIQCNFVFSALL